MKVAIAGYGVEGKTNYTYWRDLGHDVTIVDERDDLNPYDLPYSASAITGKDAFKHLADFDLVVRTASLPPRRIKTKGKVWSATNEFFEKCPAPIIGVTGTKGKGTTASLIASILSAAGKTVHLVGNIGVPALSIIATIKADDIVVFELSSFQLWDLERSPHTAVVLMIEPDHLDIHKNLNEYIHAKGNIRRHQGVNDLCIYHPTNKQSHVIAMTADKTTAKRYGLADDSQVYVRENTFFMQDHAICSVDVLRIVGAHNVENACAAISAARVYTDDDNAVQTGLGTFKGLDHRLKHVRDVRGVSYYDDSIATTPGSAMAAIRAFSEPKVLILGGKDKGADYRELVQLCAKTDTHVLTIGSNGHSIAQRCRKSHVATTELESKDMLEIVQAAQQVATEGSVVILSPAAASFDMFESYTDRGDQYVDAVEKLS